MNYGWVDTRKPAMYNIKDQDLAQVKKGSGTTNYNGNRIIPLLSPVPMFNKGN